MGGGMFFAATFYVTAAVAAASALMVVLHRNPVVSALYLVVCFFAVAVDYVLLQAHFLAVIQVLLYAGAVLVLFLMIIMLLNLGEEAKFARKVTFAKIIGVLAVGMITLLLAGSLFVYGKAARLPESQNPQRLAALLIALGEDPAKISVKVPDGMLRSQTANEQAGFAREILLYTLTPSGRAGFEIPPEMKLQMTDEKLNDFFTALAKRLESKKDINQIEVLGEYPQLNKGQLLQFIRAAVRSRLDQYINLGTTEAVGKALFQRWVLPFELSGLLLLSAILGVLLIARRTPEGGTT